MVSHVFSTRCGESDVPLAVLEISSPVLPDKRMTGAQHSANSGCDVTISSEIGVQDGFVLSRATISLKIVGIL